jgi:hypothetical protein
MGGTSCDHVLIGTADLTAIRLCAQPTRHMPVTKITAVLFTHRRAAGSSLQLSAHRSTTGWCCGALVVQVLTEGFDEPAVNAILMARPTRSEGLYTQVLSTLAWHTFHAHAAFVWNSRRQASVVMVSRMPCWGSQQQWHFVLRWQLVLVQVCAASDQSHPCLQVG